MDIDALAAYGVDEGLELADADGRTILTLQSQQEGGDWEEGEGWMDTLAPVRQDLLEGDLRPAYLAWLAAVGGGLAFGEDPEPPLPPGLLELTAAQRALADFLRLDPALLAVAAELSPASGRSSAGLEAWVKRLPEAYADIRHPARPPHPLQARALEPRAAPGRSARGVEAEPGAAMSKEQAPERTRPLWLTRPRWIFHTVSFYAWFAIGGLLFNLLLYLPLWLLCRVVPRARMLPPRLANVFFLGLLVWLRIVGACRVVRVEGKEHLHLGEPAVYVANHRSILDVILLLSRVRYVSCLLRSWSPPKGATAGERTGIPGFWKPFITAAFSLLGYVPMPKDWSDRAAMRTAYEDCQAVLKQGRPLIIFPEGTRSTTRRLLPFVDFPFKLALDAGVPVVPVALHCPISFIPKGSITLHAEARADFRMRFLPPIRARRGERAKDLSVTARRVIRKALKEHDDEFGYEPPEADPS